VHNNIMSHYVVESSRLFIGTTQKRGKEGAVVNILTSNSMLMLQRSMGFLWSKQDCILNNLANAETPGYKTQYVTFEESLRDAVQAAADKPQPGAAMREAIADTPVQLHEAQESVRMDDNGVDIMEQSVELARNGYQLQYVMSAISGELSLLRTAIRG
jgi:flagellar basal-body rod protein FlgB